MSIAKQSGSTWSYKELPDSKSLAGDLEFLLPWPLWCLANFSNRHTRMSLSMPRASSLPIFHKLVHVYIQICDYDNDLLHASMWITHVWTRRLRALHDLHARHDLVSTNRFPIFHPSVSFTCRRGKAIRQKSDKGPK